MRYTQSDPGRVIASSDEVKTRNGRCWRVKYCASGFVMEDEYAPITSGTFWLTRRSAAARAAFTSEVSSSHTTSTGAPLTPPAALTSSRAIWTPALCCSPNSAKRPVMLVITPMRTGSWASATPAVATSRNVRTRDSMVPPFATWDFGLRARVSRATRRSGGRGPRWTTTPRRARGLTRPADAPAAYTLMSTAPRARPRDRHGRGRAAAGAEGRGVDAAHDARRPRAVPAGRQPHIRGARGRGRPDGPPLDGGGHGHPFPGAGHHHRHGGHDPERDGAVRDRPLDGRDRPRLDRLRAGDVARGEAGRHRRDPARRLQRLGVRAPARRDRLLPVAVAAGALRRLDAARRRPDVPRAGPDRRGRRRPGRERAVRPHARHRRGAASDPAARRRPAGRPPVEHERRGRRRDRPGGW